ncbi:MAG TPA: TonB family protein [Thermoanaerobaculia bacterium]
MQEDPRQTREESEETDAPGTRSILGLGRISAAPFRVTANLSSNGEPPNRSLLGLGGLTAGPLPRSAVPFAAGGARPTRSLLGLEALPVTPMARAPAVSGAAEPGPPPTRGILGLRSVRAMPSFRPRPAAAPRRQAEREPAAAAAASRSFFGLQALPYVSPRPSMAVQPEPEPAAVVEVPDFEKDVEHRAEPAFPVERAVLGSLAAHVLLFVFLLSAPEAFHDPRKGLLAPFVPPEKSDEEKIPVIFKEAPGPARENPKKSDLSDADRRAGGGDRSKPRANSPFVPERQGRQGLAPGPRRPAGAPPAGSPQAPNRQAERDRSAAQQPGGATKESETADLEAMRVPKADTEGQGSGAGESGAALQGLNEAIRDAARGVGAPGDEGAGFPNPGGGFVDSGPLSFDTTWYDWGPYAAEMVRRIKLHWDVPDIARIGIKGKVTIRFYILADGRVEGATILSRSGVPPFDYAALQAIVTSSPFRPLPKDLGSEREGVTVTFFYNIRPGDEGGSGN